MSERSSVEIAREMHALSVELWNALWREAGEDPDFATREDVETVQRTLTRAAWPDSFAPA